VVSDIEQCIADFCGFIPRDRRAHCRILIDMRLAPTRVDPSLDPAFERFRKETHAGFERAAVVVSTPLGRVRAERLSNISNVPLRVVGSLKEAVAFINGRELSLPRD
jgi:hypothetical protein